MHSLAWVNLAVRKVGEQRGRGAPGAREKEDAETRRHEEKRRASARTWGQLQIHNHSQGHGWLTQFARGLQGREVIRKGNRAGGLLSAFISPAPQRLHLEMSVASPLSAPGASVPKQLSASTPRPIPALLSEATAPPHLRTWCNLHSSIPTPDRLLIPHSNNLQPKLAMPS